MLTLSTHPENVEIVSLQNEKGRNHTPVYWHPVRNEQLRNSMDSLEFFFGDENFRDRFELNNDYREVLETGGLRFSGLSPDQRLVEIAELTEHPFMVGTQFHPEFRSRPDRPHPLFSGFMSAAKRIIREGGQPRSRGGAQGCHRTRRAHLAREVCICESEEASPGVARRAIRDGQQCADYAGDRTSAGACGDARENRGADY